MTNIYSADSGEEAIVDFDKDHEELYDKTNKHFNDDARKDWLWKMFQWTHDGKLTKSKSGLAPNEKTERLLEDPHQKEVSQ